MKLETRLIRIGLQLERRQLRLLSLLVGEARECGNETVGEECGHLGSVLEWLQIVFQASACLVVFPERGPAGVAVLDDAGRLAAARKNVISGEAVSVRVSIRNEDPIPKQFV